MHSIILSGLVIFEVHAYISLISIERVCDSLIIRMKYAKKNITISYSQKNGLFKKGLLGVIIHFSQFSTLPGMTFNGCMHFLNTQIIF